MGCHQSECCVADVFGDDESDPESFGVDGWIGGHGVSSGDGRLTRASVAPPRYRLMGRLMGRCAARAG